MKSAKKIAVILLAIMLVFSLAACGSNNNAPEVPSGSSSAPTETPAATDEKPENAGPENGGVFRLVTNAEGATPLGVPWEIYGVETTLLMPHLETLVVEAADGTLEMLLAESMDVDIDNLTLTIKIKQGINFIDGTPLNAESVAWNLERIRESEQKLLPTVTKVSVTGDYEVVLDLEYYTNVIMGSFAGRNYSMISMDAFEKNGIEWARENPVGTGPFKLKNYVRGSNVTFEKNEDYWQDSKPYLDGMEYVFIRDVMTQNMALQTTGDQSIDTLSTTNGEQIQTMRDLGMQINSLPVGPISLIPSSKNADSPLKDLKVRQAISCAIDRESLVTARGFGVLKPAWQQIPEEWPQAHLPDSFNLEYNLDKAKQLLTEAGYPDGFKTLLIGQPGLADRDMVVAMQGMLAKVGIEAEVDFPDSGGYTSMRAAGWEGLLVQHTRSVANPARSLDLCYGTASVFNAGLYRPEEMFDLIKTSLSIPSTENSDAIKAVHQIAMENVLVIPCYYMYETWISKPEVKDTGFGYWGSSTNFLPANTWLASN